MPNPSWSTAAILGLCVPQQLKGAQAELVDDGRWQLMAGGDAGPPSKCAVVLSGPGSRAPKGPALAYFDDAFLPAAIRRGLPFACAENVASVLEMPMTRLFDLIVVSPSTAHRRKKEQLLSKEESDRLARIARLTAEACRVFGDLARARRWLARPHAVLGGKAPLELLDTDSGAEQVADELTRIEFGELAA
jgi:putative toxin-antitoxin system antitoxin component (TIGR02293 family)